MTRSLLDRNFWRGKRVLVTGHTGFKGGWLVLWLHRLGADITGIGLPPNTSPNLFDLANISDLCFSLFCDIRDNTKLSLLIKEAQPEIVFHLAAQPLVRESYSSPLDTFNTNIIGTANLLDSLRYLDDLLAAVIVSTDKVYRNNGSICAFREDDILGGQDPYSASKAAAELVISSYRDSFLSEKGILVASARAGNVVGGGDWSADRLIPDAMRTWFSGKPLSIRNPNTIRPWQHVLEPLSGYLSLAAALSDKKQVLSKDLFSSFNFGPSTATVATVREVIELARHSYGKCVINYDECTDGPHEEKLLILEAVKARVLLGISQKWSLSETIQRTSNWYIRQNQGEDARSLCETEIADYEACL